MIDLIGIGVSEGSKIAKSFLNERFEYIEENLEATNLKKWNFERGYSMGNSQWNNVFRVSRPLAVYSFTTIIEQLWALRNWWLFFLRESKKFIILLGNRGVKKRKKINLVGISIHACIIVDEIWLMFYWG